MAEQTPFCYRRDIPKTRMARYAEQWAGLPIPRLQLRWHWAPVPKREVKGDRRGIERGWDCFYELVLPIDSLDIRNDTYNVDFLIIPICWTRRWNAIDAPAPCAQFPTDDVWRDGSHAFWDSKALGWLPIYVVAPDGTAAWKTGYRGQPPEWGGQ